MNCRHANDCPPSEIFRRSQIARSSVRRRADQKFTARGCSLVGLTYEYALSALFTSSFEMTKSRSDGILAISTDSINLWNVRQDYKSLSSKISSIHYLSRSMISYVVSGKMSHRLPITQALDAQPRRSRSRSLQSAVLGHREKVLVCSEFSYETSEFYGTNRGSRSRIPSSHRIYNKESV